MTDWRCPRPTGSRPLRECLARSAYIPSSIRAALKAKRELQLKVTIPARSAGVVLFMRQVLQLSYMATPDVLVVANWKNNTSLSDAAVLANGTRNCLEDLDGVEVVLCPPLPWLVPVHELVASVPNLSVGLQDISSYPEGPYTGEVAASLVDRMARFAIIGHSERQFIYHETVERLQDKVRAALANKITPVICIGEERRSTAALPQLARRLGHIVKPLSIKDRGRLVVAFEPVWAISQGNRPKQAATPEYVADAARALRGVLAAETRILYGGSVTAANVGSFVEQPEIAGVLVGGASLKLREFTTIIKNAARAKAS